MDNFAVDMSKDFIEKYFCRKYYQPAVQWLVAGSLVREGTQRKLA